MPAECGNTSEGFPPFIDGGTYLTIYEAALYSGGTMPSAHRLQGIASGEAVTRLDAAGSPAITGLIGLVVVGMSNTNQETDWWEVNGFATNALQEVVLVNGAQGGLGASDMTAASYWDVVDTEIAAAGLTAAQVQWIWCKTAEPDEAGAFPAWAETMKANVKAGLQIAVARYPNLRGVSFSSRSYGGYGDLASSPSLEPWAYEGGFAFKWLIEDQIDGSDVDLDYASFPWLGWGPYLWADGETPRAADGLFYVCADFQIDGTHPADGTKGKVDTLLSEYFTTSEQTQRWFYGVIHPQETGFLANNTDQSTPYSITLTGLLADTLQLLFVYTQGGGVLPNVPTLSGCNLTWVQAGTVLLNTTTVERSRLTVFRAMGSAPVDGAVSIDLAGQLQTVCIAEAIQFIGALSTGVNGADAVAQVASNRGDAQSSMTGTLAAASDADSLVVAAWCADAVTGVTPETGWTIIRAQSSSPTAARLTVAVETYFDASATGTLTSGTADMAVLALEILPEPAAGGGDPEPGGGSDGILVMGIGR